MQCTVKGYMHRALYKKILRHHVLNELHYLVIESFSMSKQDKVALLHIHNYLAKAQKLEAQD